MTTPTTNDAGQEREALAHELADWRMRGFVSYEKSRRFFRRAKRLAKAVDITLEELIATLNDDADMILADEGR